MPPTLGTSTVMVFAKQVAICLFLSEAFGLTISSTLGCLGCLRKFRQWRNLRIRRVNVLIKTNNDVGVLKCCIFYNIADTVLKSVRNLLRYFQLEVQSELLYVRFVCLGHAPGVLSVKNGLADIGWLFRRIQPETKCLNYVQLIIITSFLFNTF